MKDDRWKGFGSFLGKPKKKKMRIKGLEKSVSDYELLANAIMYPGKTIKEIKQIQKEKRRRSSDGRAPR